MSYRQDNLKRGRRINFLLFALVLFGVFYFFSAPILSVSYSVLSFVTVPIWRLENRMIGGMESLFMALRSDVALVEENESLNDELSLIRLNLNSLESLRQENDSLYLELGRQKPIGASSTIAAVLSGPNLPPYDSLIMDAGSANGISVGDLVISEPNIVLGEISQVYKNSSKVKFYSGHGISTDALLPSRDEVLHAVILGRGGGNFSLELPSEIPVEIGTNVLMPGRNPYIIGVVGYINIDPALASQEILIKYPINIKNIRLVHVIKNFKNANPE